MVYRAHFYDKEYYLIEFRNIHEILPIYKIALPDDINNIGISEFRLFNSTILEKKKYKEYKLMNLSSSEILVYLEIN